MLADLGAERAWVVHGAGGLDEISPAGETKVAALKNGKVTDLHRSRPTDAGICRLRPLRRSSGGDAAHNAEALRAVLARREAPTATPCSSMPAPR